MLVKNPHYFSGVRGPFREYTCDTSPSVLRKKSCWFSDLNMACFTHVSFIRSFRFPILLLHFSFLFVAYFIIQLSNSSFHVSSHLKLKTQYLLDLSKISGENGMYRSWDIIGIIFGVGTHSSQVVECSSLRPLSYLKDKRTFVTHLYTIYL